MIQKGKIRKIRKKKKKDSKALDKKNVSRVWTLRTPYDQHYVCSSTKPKKKKMSQLFRHNLSAFVLHRVKLFGNGTPVWRPVCLNPRTRKD